MQVPAWLDVALEGGALELQRALVRYRSLRRTVSGDWRPRASRVAELCAAAARTEGDVERALERALRRARHDPHAGAATHLAIAVERERRRTCATIAHACGAEASMPELLEHLEDVARDECHLETAWRRFQLERVAWTTAIVFAAAAMPLSSWLEASHWLQVPTLFSLDGLRQPHVISGMIASAVALAICRLRLASWSWLGVDRRQLSPGTSAALYVGLSLTGAFGIIGNAALLLFPAIAGLAAMALMLLGSMWLLPRAPLLAPLR